MSIHILAEEVASQIAAGEVVERPASVIKELVENALDSGCRKIQVTITGSGQPLIEVVDDGCGISEKDLPLAVARHATSKLLSADDLFNIQTLGFRGEALASIGSVSQLSISSKQIGAETGFIIKVEGGKTVDRRLTSSAAGTTVRVENLFYNVPARLKFLKRDMTEKHNNDAFLIRYALAYPKVGFHVMQDGATSIRTSGSGDYREALTSLYGIDFSRQMIDVMHDDQDIHVEGFISPISLTRSNRREMTFFVNGRWIQDMALSSAVLQAYHTYLMVGRYPITSLFIHIPPEEVDVNVHPAKAEVRFKTPDRIFSAIQRAVRKALLISSPVPEITPSISWPGNPYYPNAEVQGSLVIPQYDRHELPQNTEIGLNRDAETNRNGQLSGFVPLLRLVGQIGASYLVAEGPDGLYLIDQHAAHERVLYEKFHKQGTNQHDAQLLLEPSTIALSAGQAKLLENQLETINHLGFELEPFGQNSFILRSLPALFAKMSPMDAVKVLVEDFEEDETPLQTEIEAKLIARICKRAAVKAGQILSPSEQTQLVNDLQACSSPRTCPHGRPTMIHLSVDLLERQFGRRGPR